MENEAGAGTGRHRFAIGALLGSGTFGDVYLARMTTGHGIEQEVAVKLLNPGISPKSQPVARMRDEGRMLAALNHPAILSVMDFCVLEGRIGLVTEYVQGADLHDCIYGDEVISPRAATHVIGVTADALHAAWNTPNAAGRPMQLVHRDIKPANMRLTPHGTVKLLDFGIAKSDDEHRETATQQRMAIGTPSYMAPEALTYEVLEALPSRDVFALGCTLYESIVRELYYEGLDHQEITRLSNKTERFMEWRSTRMPRLIGQDPRVIELISRMLRYNHAERPSAREVADTCLGVAERGAGPSLWAWCRAHTWPEPRLNNGPWTGRVIEDDAGTDPKTGASTKAPLEPARERGGVSPTLVVPETARPSSANPTIVAPEDMRKGTSVTVVRTGVDGQPTEIVIVHEPKSRSITSRLRDLVTVSVFLGAALTGLAWWINPEIVTGALHGDFSALASAGPGKVMRKMKHQLGQGKDSADDSDQRSGPKRKKARSGAAAADEGDEPAPSRRASGSVVRADGAGDDAAEVHLDGAWSVRVVPDGGTAVPIPPRGSVLVPPGEVEIIARFGSLVSRFEPQFTTTLRPGGSLHIVCDSERQTCDRR